MGLFFLYSCQTEEPPKGGVLVNDTWQLTEYRFGKAHHKVLPQRPISMRFERNLVSGSAGCNRYFGSFTNQGVSIDFEEISTTERACTDNELVNQEARFINLMTNARTYTATSTELIIYCTDGKMMFKATNNPAVERNSFADFLVSFMPIVNNNYHVYSTLDTKNTSNYAFAGQQFNELQLDYIEPETASLYKRLGTGVYRIGKFGDYYLLRVPGKGISNDIVLFALDKYHNRIQQRKVLAYAWCDEKGDCMHQDAWLKDVNGDKKFDVVTKEVKKNSQGKILTSKLNVFTQSPTGFFTEDTTIKLKQGDYLMKEEMN